MTRDGAELTEFARHVAGGVHLSEGTHFFLARERVLVAAGFRRSSLSLEHSCNVEHDQPAVTSCAFGGVPLFDDRESCEAQEECSVDDGSCIDPFSLGDCPSAVATSARRLRQVRLAEEAPRQRTLMLFQRIGRRGRLWMAGRTECVLVHAKRDGAELELRYSEASAGGRANTVANYSVYPLDLRAHRGSSETTYEPGGGGIGRFGSSSGVTGIPLYFGDGMVLLGALDLFFTRSACEANRAGEY